MWIFNANPIAIDTETHDPQLSKDEGPGYCRHDGFVCGISLAAKDPEGVLRAVYLPVAHAGDNLDKSQVRAFLNELFNKGEPKTFIFANATYDMGWLHNFGIRGFNRHTIRDVQIAEPLLDEEKITGYSLDVLSREYLDRSKDESAMQSLGLGSNYKEKMAMIPARYVGRYAEVDALNTYEIYFKQIPRLKEEQLWPVFELESKVTQICHHMSITGVRISIQKAEEAIASIDPIIKYLSRPLKGANINSSDEVGAYLAKAGVDLPRLKTGRISTKKEFLNGCKHKEAKRIITLRNLQKLKNDFLINGILKNAINGRIHSQFHQLSSKIDHFRKYLKDQGFRTATLQQNGYLYVYAYDIRGNMCIKRRYYRTPGGLLFDQVSYLYQKTQSKEQPITLRLDTLSGVEA